MRTTRRVAVLVSVGLSSACAYPRASLHTMSNNGRIASVTAHAETPMQGSSGKIAVPVGGVFVPVEAAPLPIPKRTYIYEVRLTEGQTVRTQSDREFAVGDCVRLWHAGGIENAKGEYNFIPGTLERDSGC